LLVLAATAPVRARQAPPAGTWQAVRTALQSLPPLSRADFEAGLKKLLAALEQWLKNNASLARPPATGDRWVVVLKHYGMGGTFGTKAADQPERCPGVEVGYEALVGIVERRALAEHWPGGVEYSGILGRLTSTGLCEVRDTLDGEKWCAGILNGSGPVEVTIALPGGTERDDFEVVLRPVASETTVTVTGSCSSLDNAAVAQQYRERDTQMFSLPDERVVRVTPTLHQALRHEHLYTQDLGAAPWSEGQFTMWVSRIGAPPTRPVR
jgi:hypothetical protein